MQFPGSELLICPLDQLPLQQEDSQLSCANGHNFDIARQGYVNLLGAGDKRSKDPGDSKEMVAARRAFLSSGHFYPLAEQLIKLVRPLVEASSIIVDAGCGEGYYLEQLRSHLLFPGGSTPALIGFDISKWAVLAASRRLAATWLVASNRHIPLRPESADCVLSVFGFPVFESFWHVLKEGGTLLTVNAGPQHLIELREILYPSVRYSASTLPPQAQAAGFSPGDISTLQFKTAPLRQLEVQQLLSMTPHLFRASHAGKERAAQLDQFAVTVDVVFQLLYRPPTTHLERCTTSGSV